MATKIGRKIADSKMIHCWGQRSCGVSWGQLEVKLIKNPYRSALNASNATLKHMKFIGALGRLYKIWHLHICIFGSKLAFAGFLAALRFSHCILAFEKRLNIDHCTFGNHWMTPCRAGLSSLNMFVCLFVFWCCFVLFCFCSIYVREVKT